eukprot:gnl/TRDRNA2_/TRDRNA2_193902_c0_seq1.p1 gnl/TRDRNA2_/TRDRNA2_193902_c0~~gnl/TRDRNA2_/TRDRNA2_193902_c0_seq1.p1  ORF type:complete len:400 (+),score=63.54 gnl/TRDRNA2_/TRDRNA2_193902_c0_seq1:80-1279(+)
MEAPKKRKRVTPELVSDASGAAPGADPMRGGPARAIVPSSASMPAGPLSGCGVALCAAMQGSADASSSNSSLWATDSGGKREVCVQDCTDGAAVVRCLESGATAWEYVVRTKVHQLVLDGGFAAFAAGHELQVLSASSGRLIFPPFALPSPVVQLELNAQGQLAAILRDGSLSVWDLEAATCRVQTSLRHTCRPAEVDALGVRPQTAEPFVRLAGQRLLLFHAKLQRWMLLSTADGAAMVAGSRSSELPPEGRSEAPPMVVGSLSDGPRLEGHLLAAICLGDVTEVRARLRALVRHCAVRDVGRLRSWCATLVAAIGGTGIGLKPGSDSSGASHSWLGEALAGLGFNGAADLREVIVPELKRFQELHAEFTAALTSRDDVQNGLSEPEGKSEDMPCTVF